jgi:hypothetical protein
VKQLRSLLAASFAMALASCTSPGALSDTALDFNETVARAADSQILLNIVRAAYRNPTHYSAITQVRDSRNVQGGASASASVPFGGDALRSYLLSPTLSASATIAPSFDVAPLDNRAAAEGLLHPIDMQLFSTYWRQGWPHMVLLFLFVDDVTINDALKRACDLTSLPAGKHVIENAVLRREQFEVARKLFECIAPRMHAVQGTTTRTILRETSLSPDAVLGSLQTLEKADYNIVEHGGKQKLYTVSKTTHSSKFILDFGRNRGTVSLAAKGERAKVLKEAGPAASFSLRSVDGMVYYLGELLRTQRESGTLLTYGSPIALNRSRVLFRVDVDAAADPSRNITADFLGKRYSISRMSSGDDRSLTVLSILSQVFALYREEKELPKTTAVEVVGAR